MAGMANKDASIVDAGEDPVGVGGVLEIMGTLDEDNVEGDVPDDNVDEMSGVDGEVVDELVEVVILSVTMVVPLVVEVVVVVVLVEVVFKLDSGIGEILANGVDNVGDSVDDKDEGCVDDDVGGNGVVAIMLHLNVWHSSIKIDDELQFSREITLDPLWITHSTSPIVLIMVVE